MIGIYKITNTINNKSYIGQSKNIENRWNKHKTLLKNNKHYNLHLQASWNKYGESNFVFEIIEICNEEILNKREIFYIKKFNSLYNGYNQTAGGDGLKNYNHSNTTKLKISKASKGRKLSQEHKQKLIAAVTGRKKSKDELEKLSKAAKGRKISEWHKQQLINSTKGKPFSKEHKKNLSKACKGRVISEQQKKDISNTLKGNKNAQKLSNEQKQEIKELLIQNIKVNEIAKKYNVSCSTIYGIKQELKNMTDN